MTDITPLIALGVIAAVGWVLAFILSAGLKELLNKSDIANIVAAATILVGVIYSAATNNTEMLKYFASFAIGYLFGKK